MPSYLSEQPLARVGVAVDSELRARHADERARRRRGSARRDPVARGLRRGHRAASGYLAAHVTISRHDGMAEIVV